MPATAGGVAEHSFSTGVVLESESVVRKSLFEQPKPPPEGVCPGRSMSRTDVLVCWLTRLTWTSPTQVWEMSRLTSMEVMAPVCGITRSTDAGALEEKRRFGLLQNEFEVEVVKLRTGVWVAPHGLEAVTRQ